MNTPRSTGRVYWLALLTITALGLGLVSASLGVIAIPVGDVWTILWGGGNDETMRAIVLDVRLPRIATALAVGLGLGLSGAIFQGILLNPLADPFTLGVSSGAAFGASIALLLGLAAFGPHTVAVFAFGGAVLTLMAVMAIAGKDGYRSPTSLILAGVIVAAILSAGVSFVKYLADERVAAIVFWLMGSLSAATWDHALVSLTGSMLALLLGLFLARDLNALSLGGRSAASLGVNPERTRALLLGGASLAAGACVSVSGIIGFVGLVVPHLMRLLVGPDNRFLIPASALAGGILLLLADTLTRAVLPAEVPVGVLTALIGGPAFCWLYRKRFTGGRHD